MLLCRGETEFLLVSPAAQGVTDARPFGRLTRLFAEITGPLASFAHVLSLESAV